MVPVLFSTTYMFTKGSKIGKSKSGEKLDTVTLTWEAEVGGQSSRSSLTTYPVQMQTGNRRPCQKQYKASGFPGGLKGKPFIDQSQKIEFNSQIPQWRELTAETCPLISICTHTYTHICTHTHMHTHTRTHTHIHTPITITMKIS